jgi:hypothetical protein
MLATPLMVARLLDQVRRVDDRIRGLPRQRGEARRVVAIVRNAAI